jgi:putative hemolysin
VARTRTHNTMDLLTRTGGYTLLLADDADQVAAAQRLRHPVFAGELGATLHTREPGLDVDELDVHCDHLIVRDDATGAVINLMWVGIARYPHLHGKCHRRHLLGEAA